MKLPSPSTFFCEKYSQTTEEQTGIEMDIIRAPRFPGLRIHKNTAGHG